MVAMKGCCCTNTSKAGANLWMVSQTLAAMDRLRPPAARERLAGVFEKATISSRDGQARRGAMSIPLHRAASGWSAWLNVCDPASLSGLAIINGCTFGKALTSHACSQQASTVSPIPETPSMCETLEGLGESCQQDLLEAMYILLSTCVADMKLPILTRCKPHVAWGSRSGLNAVCST